MLSGLDLSLIARLKAELIPFIFMVCYQSKIMLVKSVLYLMGKKMCIRGNNYSACSVHLHNILLLNSNRLGNCTVNWIWQK